MGVSTLTWANYMIRRLSLDLPPQAVIDRVVESMRETYRRAVPYKPGAVDTVRLAAGHFRVGLASGSEKSLIDIVVADGGYGRAIRRGGLHRRYAARQTRTGRLPRGRPPARGRSPRVRLPRGLRRGHSVGQGRGDARHCRPRSALPPKPELLVLADLRLDSLTQVDLAALTGV